MLLTVMFSAAILAADLDQPVSALEAVDTVATSDRTDIDRASHAPTADKIAESTAKTRAQGLHVGVKFRRGGSYRWLYHLDVTPTKYEKLIEKLSERELPFASFGAMFGHFIQSILGVTSESNKAYIALVRQVIAEFETNPPVSATDALHDAIIARMTDRFIEPDAETAVLLSKTVATVNGRKISTETVLSRYMLWLIGARTSSEREYSDLVEQLIRREASKFIQAAALEDHIRREFSPKQMAAFERDLKPQWKREQLRLAQELQKLDPNVRIPTSLEAIRAIYFQHALAEGYFEWKFPKSGSGIEGVPVVDFDRQRIIRQFTRDIVAKAKIESDYNIDEFSRRGENKSSGISIK